MEARLQARIATGYSGRTAAGYCWSWSKPKAGYLFPDVQIGIRECPWNNPKDTRVGDAPGRPFWATDPDGFDQVGCIYTAQGFEYDYGGVIMGPDLVWRTDRWVPQPDRDHDSQVKRGTPAEFDSAVRNTYQVLLTRGLRAPPVMSTDAETQAMLRALVSHTSSRLVGDRQ